MVLSGTFGVGVVPTYRVGPYRAVGRVLRGRNRSTGPEVRKVRKVSGISTESYRGHNLGEKIYPPIREGLKLYHFPHFTHFSYPKSAENPELPRGNNLTFPTFPTLVLELILCG